VENKSDCDISCRYVPNNGPWQLVDLALESTELYRDAALWDLDHTVHVSEVVIVLFLVGMFVVVVLQMLPMLTQIRRTKQTMSDALSKLPTKLLHQLRKQALAKSVTVRMQMVGFFLSS